MDPMLGVCFAPESANSNEAIAYDRSALLAVSSASEDDCMRLFHGPCPSLLQAQILAPTRGPWLTYFNPAIVELPSSFAASNPGLEEAKFALVMRRDSNQCHKLVKGLRSGKNISDDMPGELNKQPGQLVLLNANYCVIAAAPLETSGPVDRLAQDVRVLVHDGELYASYVMWQYDPTRTEGKGFWLAPVELTHSHQGLSARANSARGVRLGGFEEKNFGSFHVGSELRMLTWLGQDARPPALAISDGKFRSDTWKRDHWHNSVNLLDLDDGSGDLLGIMHVHRDTACAQGGHCTIEFGSTYTYRFFRCSGQSPFNVTSVSDEFCMKDADGGCEAIQMVMSLIRSGSEHLLLSYGVNDCEPRIAKLQLATVLESLVHVSLETNATVQTMRVPHVDASLRALAERVSAAPEWRFGERKRHKHRAYEAGLRLPLEVHKSANATAALTQQPGGGSLGGGSFEACPSKAGPYGDWPICLDWLGSPCVVYDIGIANEWAFSDSMASKHGCEVHAFDPSDGFLDEHRAHHKPNVHFHFKGLAGRNNASSNASSGSWQDKSGHNYGEVIGPVERLDRIMKNLGHKKIDVLKIDCEGCEWESLAAVTQAAPRALGCVRMLLIELHFAKRFLRSSESMSHAAEVAHYIESNGWRTWFAAQRGWGPDRLDQEVAAWRDVGGDSCCYNVGFVNPHFDEQACQEA